jgi:aryl-alcohol dehydrogenase-like predicted oxidoreductase
LEENVRAVDVHLTEGEIARIEEALPKGAAAGTRYDAAMLELVDR